MNANRLVARFLTAELLTKQWLMGVRRGWLHLLTVKPKGWPAIFKAFDDVIDFVNNLEEQVLYVRRTPNWGEGSKSVSQRKTQDSNLEGAFAKLKSAIIEKRRGAKHWYEAENQELDWMGRGSFTKEDGEKMRALYEEKFGDLLTTYVKTKIDKAKGQWNKEREAPITELVDKVLELLRAEVALLEKTIKTEEGVLGPDTESPTKDVFRDPAFKEFSYGNMKVIVTDPKGKGHLIRSYVRILDIAHQLMSQKGFGNLWYGVLFLQSADYHKLEGYEKERYEQAGYKNLQSLAGTYGSGEDMVTIMAPANDYLIKTICHELGHRYWFKRMTGGQRARFEDLIRVNRNAVISKPIDTKELEDARKKILGARHDVKELLTTFEEDFRSAADSAEVEKVIREHSPKLQAGALHDPIYDILMGVFNPDSLYQGSETTPEERHVYDEVSKEREKYTGTVASAEGSFRQHMQPASLEGAWKSGMSDGVNKWIREAHKLLFDVEDVALDYLKYLEKAAKETLDPDESKVLPVSEYGKTNPAEAFAEAFAYYVTNKDMDRDQIESFKAVLASSLAERIVAAFLKRRV